MNPIHLLSSHAWVDRLGSTLLHFLWQGIAIAALFAAARRVARDSGPAVRYWLACTALATMALAPVVTWSLLGPPPANAVIASFHAPLSADAAVVTRGSEVSLSPVAAIAATSPVLPWVVALWLTGAVAFWLRLLGGWIFAERLRFQWVRPAPPEWQQTLERLKAGIRVSRPVRLMVSAAVQAPAVVGWLRPIVLAPVGALAGLPAGQMEALLLHELAHIRRHDYVVNLLQSVVEALLFYHPAVWWISGQIRAERELCCDDVAVSVTGDAVAYARALADLAAQAVALQVAMAATGGSLRLRIARLLGQARPMESALPAPAIVTAGALLAVTAFGMFAQQEARPKFEVSSVKAAPDQNFQMVRPLPGRLTAQANLRMLMVNAYAVQGFQIVGAPGWIDSDRFAIEAKAHGDASRSEVFLMLQSLLEDRFQLKFHRETRELPVYALVAAKNGIKLSAPKDGGCVESDAATTQVGAGVRIPPPGQGQAPMAPCGRIGVMMAPGGAQMGGGKVPMAELIRTLSMVVGRTVIDRTGYTKPFDFQLRFLPDEVTDALPPPPPGSAPSPDAAPSILIALQEQLGLRLENTKGPVDAMVIDHVEKPSGN